MLDKIPPNPPPGSIPLMNPAARRHLLSTRAPPQPDFEGSVYELLVEPLRRNSMLHSMMRLKRPTPMGSSPTMMMAIGRCEIRRTKMVKGGLCPMREEMSNSQRRWYAKPKEKPQSCLQRIEKNDGCRRSFRNEIASTWTTTMRRRTKRSACWKK